MNSLTENLEINDGSEESDENVPKKKIKISRTATLNDKNDDEINIENKEKHQAPKLKKTESLGLEENLICNICQDLLYKCVSIQPCLHSFCSGCLLQWRLNSKTCPNCRLDIQGVSRNHLIQDIVDKYSRTHTENIKSVEAKKEMDKEVEEKKDILFASCGGNIGIGITNNLQNENNCPICNYPGRTVDLVTSLHLEDFECDATMVHIQCHCCHIYMADDNAIDNRPIQCNNCQQKFCALLYEDCRNCTHGCLHIFRDYIKDPNLNPSHNQVPIFLPDNYYETNVLRNYLQNHNKTATQMYDDALDQLNAGTIIINPSITTTDTVLCNQCCKEAANEMIYQYYTNVPRQQLPIEVTSRPNCYYGRNCRTQRTRQHHAVNYNHACAQTRFH